MKKGIMKIVTKEISCDKDGKGYETSMEIQNMSDEHVVLSLVEVIGNYTKGKPGLMLLALLNIKNYI